jgi:beta-lactamase regulating signal transducer with metallopeptidase domain/HEAT repeat protein
MPWYLGFYAFLLRFAAESTLVLAAATVAVALVRQPVRKLRIIEWSFVACLLLTGLTMLDVGRHWSCTWPRAAQPTEEARQRRKAPKAGETPAPQTRQPGGTPAPEAQKAGETPAPQNATVVGMTDAQGSSPAPQLMDAANDDPAASRWTTRADARFIVVVGYLMGIGMMAAWWLVGFVALLRLLRQAAPADERCRAAFRGIAGADAANVRLVVSQLAAQPFVCGWWRTVIVLPQRLAEGDARVLRYAMAHEWSHVARGDSLWWSLAGVVRLLCFFQPLVWMLRSKLRLAQDYLADAEAAGQAPAAEDYAQFLTDWAATSVRCPLYGGLGILGRQSDLYRRVVILVQTPQPLDRRCPRRWNAAVAVSLIALVALSTTFGGADDAQPPGSTKRAVADAPPRKSKSEKVEQQPPQAAGANTPQQARLDKLVDGILARARAIHAGRFQFERTIDGAASDSVLFNDMAKADFSLVLAGQDWAVVRSERTHFGAVYHDVMVRREGRLITLLPSRSPAGRAELQIESPLSASHINVLAAVRAGTLPSEALAKFVDEHRYDAQFAEGERTQDFRTTTRMEWKVAAADAGRVFDATSGLLSSGGLLRIDVAEEDGFVLPLVEYVDRFGGVEARFLAGQFVDVAPGIVFPERYHVSQDAEIQYDFQGIKLINARIPADDFELRSIPAGTHVRDVRLRKGPDGRLIEKSGPLIDFTLGAVYGLPKEMLAAMDEGVLSDEEAKKIIDANRSSEQAGSDVARPKTLKQRKENLRYSGRSFGEWREKLLNDLDPTTCTTAMEPIAAFGKMGYADEAVAALAEVLHSDRAAANGGIVLQHAASALAKLGAPATPALIEGLADPRPTIRATCAQAIAQLRHDGKAATEALVKVLDDKLQPVREAAVQSLIAVAGDDDNLRTTFERLADSDDANIRSSFAQALNWYPPHGDWWIRPCLRLANDEDRNVRIAVGSMLANHGPVEKQVIEAVEELIRDDDRTVSNSPVVALAQGDGNNVALLAAVLADAIKSAKLWNEFKGGQLTFAIRRLADAPEQATASVPLLIEIVEMRIPNFQDEPLVAIDALGKLGPAAKDAIPVLERWVARSDVPADDPYKKHARRALEKIRIVDDATGKDN